VVAFLREHPGVVQSDVYAGTLPGGVMRNITQTPRRVGSPQLVATDEGIGVAWLQQDPDLDGWQVAFGSPRVGILERLRPAPWRGTPGETAAVITIGVPLSAVMALYWTAIGNGLLLAVLAGMVALLYRFAPTIARRQPLLVGAVVVAGAVGLTGAPWIAFWGPSPGWIYRLVVAIVMLAVVGVRARTGRVRAAPSEPIGIIFLSILLTVCGGAYHETLELLADRLALPLVL
jgi:hypothetical protein